jgi:hypothetical protein
VRKMIGSGVLVLTQLTSTWATPVLVAPNDSASHVALCATSMGR